MTNIIGIDSSTRSGIAVLSEDPKFFFTTELENKKLKGLERVVWFGEAVGRLLETYKPEVAIIEGYGFANSHTLVPLVEIGTVIRLSCHSRGINIVCIPPNSLKQFTTGAGSAKKEMMLLEIFRRWGFEAATNNIADAYCLARVGKAIYGYDKITKEAATKLSKIDSVSEFMTKKGLSF